MSREVGIGKRCGRHLPACGPLSLEIDCLVSPAGVWPYPAGFTREALGHASMGASDNQRSTSVVPPDLLPVIRRSGVLSDRQFEEVCGKITRGDIPAIPPPWPRVSSRSRS